MNTRIIHFPFGTIIGLAIALLLLVLPIPARTATSEPANITFVVDDQSDSVDNNLGDGVCLTTHAKCTLRAAIQEATAQYAGHPGAADTISLPGAPTVVSPPTVYSLTIAGSGEDLSATGDLDIKANLVLRTTNGQAALVSASSLNDRVFHIIQPPIGGGINVRFQNIWIAQGVATDGGSDGRIGGGGLFVGSACRVTLGNGGVLSHTAIVPVTETGSGAGCCHTTPRC